MTAALDVVRAVALIGERRSLIVDLLPADVPAPRFTRAIQAALMRSPKLRNAEPESLQAAVVDAAALGVVVGDGLAQGWLVVDKQNRAKLMLGYKFVPVAARRLGFRISSGNVREGDEFSHAIENGKASIHHRPSLALPARRPLLAAYALASPIDHKGEPLAVVLGRPQILDIREHAPAMKAGKPTPWREVDSPAFGRMAEKSAVRRLLPSLPLGSEAARAAGAALNDGDEASDFAETRSYVPGDDTSPRAGNGARRARATDVEAEVVERQAPTFPEFDKLGEFATWSRSYLRRCRPGDALAWLDHFGGRLDQAAASGRPEVVSVVDELRHLARGRAAGA